MKIKVFSSGSDGNSTVVIANNKNILIDLGITRKQIVENLETVGLGICDLDAILITHEHTDHIKALPTMLKEIGVPIFISRGTLSSIYDVYKASGKTKLVELIDKRFNDGSIIILPHEDN